jgi:hypothetical protein
LGAAHGVNDVFAVELPIDVVKASVADAVGGSKPCVVRKKSAQDSPRVEVGARTQHEDVALVGVRGVGVVVRQGEVELHAQRDQLTQY